MTRPDFPHDYIQETEDRSWTLRLLDAVIKSEEGDDLEDVFDSLSVLDDYRVLEPLTRILVDRSAPAYLREAASEILHSCNTNDTEEERRSWWSSGDTILMRHAVIMAERTETDLIEMIANNPEHEFYIDAIDKLSVRFTEPKFQRLKIKALSNPDKEIQYIAARALYWDQPVAAEEALISAAGDDDNEVAQEATKTLTFYCSRRVVTALANLAGNGPETRRAQAEEALAKISQDVLDNLRDLERKDSAAAAYFKSWLSPVWDILSVQNLAPSEQTIHGNSTPDKDEELRHVQSASEIMSSLDNPDQKWATRWKYMDSIDWISLSNKDRAELIQYFSNHPDWSVRKWACPLLSKMQAAETLLAFLDDPFFTVRTSSTYYIREVAQDNRIANRLWEMIQNQKVDGTHASEALGSHVKHSEDTHIDDRLAELALTDERESIKVAAIELLSKRAAREQIKRLLPLLKPEPFVTWASHDRIIDACHNLNIPIPGIEALSEVDDIWLQQSLALYLGKRE